MTDKQIITKSQMIMRIAELTANLIAKEQECEKLKKIINEAKNSKLDLKSFLVGEAVQNEYEQQLDQLKAENERLKHDNEYEVGALEKTIDNLKAELEQEKALKEVYLACYKTKHEDIKGELFKLRQYKASKQASYEALQKKCNELELENRELKKCYKNNSALLDFEEANTTKIVNKVMKLEQTLTEIKEIANLSIAHWDIDYLKQAINEILQKISEVLENE